VPTPTDRLRPAPDDQSPTGTVRNRHKSIGTAPQYPGCVNNRCGAGPTHNSDEGADMAKNTRGPDPADRWTRDSGVNIAPPTQPGPATTTRTVA